MQLSVQNFEALLRDEQLVLGLVGMSSIGKTAWSRKLVMLGFRHVNCDDMIEEKLGHELQAMGFSGIHDVARWMGHPYEDHYLMNEKKYLDFEVETMRELLEEMSFPITNNTVIDTTGSVVHTGDALCHRLKEESLVVHIAANQERMDRLYNKYLKQPKPIVFDGYYNSKKGESTQAALQRSYRELLEHRAHLYEKYADITIPVDELSRDMTGEDFISILKTRLL